MFIRNKNREAKLIYEANSFRIVRGGDHVICKATGQLISLDELRYWSVERQEPYCSAHEAARIFIEHGAKK